MCLFKHNENAYKEMAQYLDTKNRALLVLGTSGGKTTTALEYIYQNNGRALVLCPTNGIKIDWEAKDVCDAYTYQAFSFNDFYKTIDYSKYCVVILDESHHVGYDEKTDTGAKSWSKSVKWIFDNNKCKVLGLTATNERTDGIDLAKTFFDGCTVYGLAVEDMIEQGILYPFSYVTAIYNYHEIMSKFTDLRSTGDETTKGLLGQLDLSINNTKTVNTILNEYTKKQGINKIKGIVFVSPNKNEEKNTINEAKSIILNSFPNMKNKVRVLYSDDSYMKNEGNTCEENKEWFEKSDEGIIITINKAGEGWHPKGINVLIMFRKTNSYLVFTQQLGRIMTLKTQDSVDPRAIVFDLVNNIENIRYNDMTLNKKEIEERPIVKIVRALEKINSGQIIVADETRDVVECLKEIKKYLISIGRNKPFTPEDEQKLVDYYNSLDGKKANIEDLLKLFPNRTPGSILNKAISLGITAKKYQWTKEKDELIKNLYPVMGNELLKQLPGVSKQQLQQRASKLKVKSPQYNKYATEEKINLLRIYYPQNNWEKIEEIFPGKSHTAIVALANEHNIHKDNRGWTSEQDALINKEYPLLGGKALKEKYLEIFNNKSYGAINSHAKTLGLKCVHNRKKILCVELNQTFDSITEAAVFIKKSVGLICIALKDSSKTAGDYHWQYVE